MSFYRDRLAAEGILGSRQLAECPNGRRVWVVDLLIGHQTSPTAKNFHFLTLENPHGWSTPLIGPQCTGAINGLFRRSIC